jgi:hypothetical protein
MDFLMSLADFLISQWMWGVTWGIYHVFLSAVFMTILLKIVMRIKIIKALILSVTAHVFAVAIYSFVVIFFLMPLIDSDFYMSPQTGPINPGRVTLYLGLIYSVLQLLFFMVVQRNLRLIQLITVILISNCLAAGFISLTLPCM